ncbi:MAG: N-6 DNA methylase [Sphingomonas sp.]|nr:N-6 DNA methylase [Sphingomonas sp.]
MATEQLIAYAARIRELLRANSSTSEPALAPAFQQLTTDLLPSVPAGAGLTVSPEYDKPETGRPDIALVRAGQLPRAFIELKLPKKHLEPTLWREAHDKRQFGRFRELPIWALSNFKSIRLFQRGHGETILSIVPEAALLPETSDSAAEALIKKHDASGLLELLSVLAQAQPPSPASAAQLAEFLAHGARLVRASVLERLTELRIAKISGRPLQVVREEFRNVLYAHPEAGGYRGEFDTLFSAAFAQTLAFGLLLVREATNKLVGPDSWKVMPEEHPLLKTALRVLSEDEIVQQIDLGFDVLIDTVNSFDPRILTQKPGRADPILYFYEDFLGTFDADAKQRYGVYYTPVEVVRYMVGALDRALKDNLGTSGLSDPDVTILDPATGTGTFLLGIAERVRDAASKAGPGAAYPALRQLASRMFAFELLIGPYAVAHYRLHHSLAEKPEPGVPPPPPLPRLGIYLADTLARAGTSTPLGGLGYIAEPIRHERDEADRIKREQRILAIIGNPPYWRFQGVNTRDIVGPFIDEKWDDLKEPVRQAGWANQLNTFPEFSIAFWRWAIWKMFEAENAPRKGVIAFITNRTFIAGKPYAGLRKMLRERFDRIEIIDLRGDLRRGARAGVHGDTGVFNILVGTAITLAIADGSKPEGALAEVSYNDVWEQELFAREAKLKWLEEGSAKGTRPGPVQIDRGPLDDFKPVPFGVQGWPSLASIFDFASSGVQSKRDAFVYDVSRERLSERIQGFKSADAKQAPNLFYSTTTCPWDVAQAQPLDDSRLVPTAYRPLDRRYLYNQKGYLDRPRPSLQEAWGVSNTALYAMPFGTGDGPAVWCHALLPDYHSFSGRGGYAFPLYDRRAGHGPVNVSPRLLDGLALAYTAPVEPLAVFDASLALLSAASYTLRFAEDLEDTFPHVPFPADKTLFDRAAAVGKSIREVETFAREPESQFVTPTTARIETAPHGPLADIGPEDWHEGDLLLCENGSGKVSGIPRAVWEFAVSGYPLLPRWLGARRGIDVDAAFIHDFRDITGRINELIHRFDEADIVLQEALNHSLTRDQLGLEPVGDETADE